MNVIQCRMARAGLGWSLDDLAQASTVARRTIAKFEQGGPIRPENVEALRSALVAQGVVFIERGAHVGGVVPPRVG